jgi:hypothetical protein
MAANETLVSASSATLDKPLEPGKPEPRWPLEATKRS